MLWISCSHVLKRQNSKLQKPLALTAHDWGQFPPPPNGTASPSVGVSVVSKADGALSAPNVPSPAIKPSAGFMVAAITADPMNTDGPTVCAQASDVGSTDTPRNGACAPPLDGANTAGAANCAKAIGGGGCKMLA
jgi:hypothetical protein